MDRRKLRPLQMQGFHSSTWVGIIEVCLLYELGRICPELGIDKLKMTSVESKLYAL